MRKNTDAIRNQTTIRIVVGSEDGLSSRNRAFHNLLTELKIPHEYHEIEGVRHTHAPLYDRLGDRNWEWLRRALQSARRMRPFCPHEVNHG